MLKKSIGSTSKITCTLSSSMTKELSLIRLIPNCPKIDFSFVFSFFINKNLSILLTLNPHYWSYVPYVNVLYVIVIAGIKRHKLAIIKHVCLEAIPDIVKLFKYVI